MKGEAYLFRRRSGAMGMGHVGWGYLTDPSKSLYCFGATENLSGKMFVAPGQNNDAWVQTGSIQTMLNTMRQGVGGALGYDDYKRNWVEPIHAKRAWGIASTRAPAGYGLMALPGQGNNCADHAYQIIEAYGVTGMPMLQFLPGPNAWFDAMLFGWDYFRDLSGTCAAESAAEASGEAPETEDEAEGVGVRGAKGKLVKVKPKRGGGNTPKTAIPVARGSTVEGELAAGAACHYKVELQEGETIKFTIYTQLRTDANYVSGTFAVLDEEGGVLGETNFLVKATGEDFTRERYEFEAEDTGTIIFRIRTEDQDADMVTYKIKL